MMNRLHGMARPMNFVQRQQPVLKVLFGCARPDENDVSVGITGHGVTHVAVPVAPKTANLFVRPVDQMKALFDQVAGGGGYLAALVEKLVGKTALADDGQSNLFSPLPKAPAKEKQPDAALARRIGQAFNKALGSMPKDARELTISLPPLTQSAIGPYTAIARELAEQATLQGYNPFFQRPNKPSPFKLKNVQLANLPRTPETLAALNEGAAIGRGTNLTRYMVDTTPPAKNPLWLSNLAKELEARSKHGTMRVDVLQKADLERERMGMALAVAAGNQPTDADQIRMPVMTYTPKDGKYDKTILLVGKGIVFDTGGVNLKTGADDQGIPYIHDMHGDMAGAAAVVGAMKIIDDMQLKGVRVVGITPFTPNRIGSFASLPHTQVLARNGLKVEISNTDAEGRLVLGDAIHYGAEKFNPDLIVDIATLTGGKVAALGDVNSVAVMGNNYKLSKKVQALETHGLGRKAEAIELTKAHRRWVTEDGLGRADIYNSVGLKGADEKYELFGKGVKYERSKHIIHHSAQGGAFLREFLPNPKTPFVHLDMAGAEFAKNPHLGKDSGFATGFGAKDLYTIVKAATQGDLLKK